MNYCYFDSPIGDLLLAGTKSGLELISFPTGNNPKQPQTSWQYEPQYFINCLQQLGEYFAGTRFKFDLPYIIDGSAFKVQVLNYVATIPYGTTASYGEIAQVLNHPKAARAVGMANATNNLPIIVPCHRVIGKDGSLTGFAGGIKTKEYLLALEKRAS